jgi:superfamily II DNA or RNA helicase
MARVQDISRTREVFEIYKKYKEFNPTILHSKVKNRNEIIKRLLNREIRIIICVDMLGEGFDMPSLKIAALHDVHKSLGITLQFTGRFTRTNIKNIGDAT